MSSILLTRFAYVGIILIAHTEHCAAFSSDFPDKCAQPNVGKCLEGGAVDDDCCAHPDQRDCGSGYLLDTSVSGGCGVGWGMGGAQRTCCIAHAAAKFECNVAAAKTCGSCVGNPKCWWCDKDHTCLLTGSTTEGTCSDTKDHPLADSNTGRDARTKAECNPCAKKQCPAHAHCVNVNAQTAECDCDHDFKPVNGQCVPVVSGGSVGTSCNDVSNTVAIANLGSACNIWAETGQNCVAAALKNTALQYCPSSCNLCVGSHSR